MQMALAAWTLCLAVSLVLAGCGQPGPDPDSDATANPTDPDGLGGLVDGPGGNGTIEPDPGGAGEPGGSGMPPAPRMWASLSDATIRPGVQVVSSTGQCTSNFVFTSPDNLTVYIGVAAHCVNTSSDATGTATDGCDERNTPFAVGTKVEVEGADDPGILVYTSWGTMQNATEDDESTCAYNDFAVIRLSDADAANVNPAMLKYGGPTGLADPGDMQAMDKVLTFGNSGLRFGVEPLREKEGYVLETDDWSTSIYTASPGVEGDSGSAVILADGRAVGNLVTSQIAPYPGANGVSNLMPELDYAREKAGLDLRLATWDVLDDGVLPPA